MLKNMNTQTKQNKKHEIISIIRINLITIFVITVYKFGTGSAPFRLFARSLARSRSFCSLRVACNTYK